MATISENVTNQIDKLNTLQKKQNNENTKLAADFVKNSTYFILLNVPSGKPNRADDGKTRVEQSAQKGSTCWYYARKTLAIQSKDYIQKQRSSARKIISGFRKTKTEINKIYHYITTELNLWKTLSKQKPHYAYKGFFSLDKQKSTQTIQTYITALQNSCNVNYYSTLSGEDQYILQLSLIIIVPFLQKFMNSTENNIMLYPFRYQDEMLFQSLQDTFVKLNLNPEREALAVGREFQKLNQAPYCTNRYKDISHKLDNLDFHLQFELLWVAFIRRVNIIYNLKPITWTPNHDINLLFDTLASGKPVTAQGRFGAHFYNKSQVEIGSIEHYKIMSFPKDSHDPSLDAGSHQISIIGLQRKLENSKDGWIYYVDPALNSHPLKKRTIFKISYDEFCKNCFNESIFVDRKTQGFNYAFA